jgi:23S rRNA (cytidine1920-2'-O)/16S rRNA (cytidine1409-2'-O)-methyltransferase
VDQNKHPERIRLDTLLVQRGLAASRGEAQHLIDAGLVSSSGQLLSKGGQALPPDIALEVQPLPVTYASRGALKLEAALAAFPVPVAGVVAMDVGASTGGFTDVLLRHGAARVYAIDVGYGQLAYTLRNDARVIVMERTNIRHVKELPERPALATIDVAFISLDLVLPVVQRLLAEQGQAICLIKPQFEVGKQQVGKGGVVRDPEAHSAVVERVLRHALDGGWSIGGILASPITGPAGNREFLAWLHHDRARQLVNLHSRVEEVTHGRPAAHA